MRSSLTCVVAPLLILAGLTLCSAPAMAQARPPHYVHKPVSCYPATGWRNEARHQAQRVQWAVHVRTDHVRAAHVRVSRHR
jgi:hypothetical protein